MCALGEISYVARASARNFLQLGISFANGAQFGPALVLIYTEGCLNGIAKSGYDPINLRTRYLDKHLIYRATVIFGVRNDQLAHVHINISVRY